jgi:hypothetical protein
MAYFGFGFRQVYTGLWFILGSVKTGFTV